jgi:hypothetical protein
MVSKYGHIIGIDVDVEDGAPFVVAFVAFVVVVASSSPPLAGSPPAPPSPAFAFAARFRFGAI